MSRPFGMMGRFARDRRGVSAVEFALIAPILIFFYFGLAEFCQAYMSQKRMGHSAAMVADLIAQTDVVTEDQIDDVFGVGDLIMRPFSSAGLAQRVTSVTRDEDGAVKVDWSRGRGMSPLGEGETMTIPDDLIEDGQSLIVSEATYDYESPVDYFMEPVTQFSQIHYLRPRIVETVGCSDC